MARNWAVYLTSTPTDAGRALVLQGVRLDEARRQLRDTLNKAIMAMIVLAGGVLADENCLLRVVGDSSILSVSPHRDRLWTGSGSIGPFEPSAAHATLPDDAPPSAGCQTPAAPPDAPCSCPIHGSAPWHNQSGASHTGMDAPPWPSPMP